MTDGGRPTPPVDADDRTPAERARERAEISRARRARIVLDRVLSASAGVVALCALGVSVYQTYIMREQQRLGAWPSLVLYQSNASGWSREVRNVGIGPALVRSVTLRVDGRPVRTWAAAFRAVLGEAGLDSIAQRVRTDTTVRYTTSTFASGSVLLPGEKVEMMEIGPRAFGGPLRARVGDRLVMAVCYCSFYGDCWITRTDAREPAPTRGCTIDAVEFQD